VAEVARPEGCRYSVVDQKASLTTGQTFCQGAGASRQPATCASWSACRSRLV